MAKIYNYDVMFDDTSIDVSKEVALVWSMQKRLLPLHFLSGQATLGGYYITTKGISP